MRVARIYEVYASILISSLQKAQHHVFVHSSTRTIEGSRVSKEVSFANDLYLNLQLCHLHHRYIQLVT
jgi:hypothetical protein